MFGRAVPLVVAAVEGGALAFETVYTGVGGSCVLKALETTVVGARASAAEVSAEGCFVLEEACAHLEARNSSVLNISAGLDNRWVGAIRFEGAGG